MCQRLQRRPCDLRGGGGAGATALAAGGGVGGGGGSSGDDSDGGGGGGGGGEWSGTRGSRDSHGADAWFDTDQRPGR
ncbi:hypothetical protein RF55_2666 [Lasius niger]|uniref:Uncharacterized protein n=1 Tax=Lasius niger TaxID=67767 RepID=A0A0J7L2L7_LASNI|nr:hypothetical protein RF55_2666 [Lasius niger]